VKAGGPLGLSIVGGVDHSSHPFGADEPGIFVSKVTHLSHHYHIIIIIITSSSSSSSSSSLSSSSCDRVALIINFIVSNREIYIDGRCIANTQMTALGIEPRTFQLLS
jgi:hypothetical protein